MNEPEESLSESSVTFVALGSTLFAALAAVAAMLSNHYSDSAVLDQIQASAQWGYYQSKGIKGNLLANKVDLLTSLGKLANQSDLDKIAQYKKEQDDISESAREKERSSNLEMKHHVELARGVSLFQLAIAVSAISILTRRRRLWHASMLAAGSGVFFLIHGLLLHG
jgi:hypothetical protein